MKILAIGDIHLGRSIPVIPDTFLDRKDIWLEAALNNILEVCRLEKIDLALFTGDIIENEDDRFEALPVLSKFIKSLSETGIQAAAIAGNHDTKALFRIKKLIPELFVFNNSEWESKRIELANGEKVNIIGISHRQSRKEDLFKNFDNQLCNQNIFNIGLLHCNLGSAPDKYVPVKKEELLSTSVDLWLLGHIHKPDVFDVKTKFGYLGSIIGLDISETGMHGVQLIEIEKNFPVDNRKIPVAPLRWETINIDISGLHLSDPEELKDGLIETVKNEIFSFLNNIQNELDYTKAIGFRVMLSGSINPNLDINYTVEEFSNFHLDAFNKTEIFIEKMIDRTIPDIDISKMSEQNDPAGLLSKIYKDIQQGKNQQLLNELTEFIEKRTSIKQRHYINEFIRNNDIKTILSVNCKNTIIKLINHNQ